MFLALGFTGILILLSDVVTNGVGTVLVGAVAAVGIGALWFGMPLARLRAQRREPSRDSGGNSLQMCVRRTPAG